MGFVFMQELGLQRFGKLVMNLSSICLSAAHYPKDQMEAYGQEIIFCIFFVAFKFQTNGLPRTGTFLLCAACLPGLLQA
jgi:hypothetical protein